MEANLALATDDKPIEEGIKDWTAVIETLERIQKDFGSKEGEQEPLWECKEIYEDGWKKACRSEVIEILKLCGKERLFKDNPTVVNSIYANRLSKIQIQKTCQKEQKTMDESSDIIAITPAACKKDIDKEWSKSEVELWEKFLKELKDQDYVNSYREYIVTLKETAVNKTIAAEDLEKKGYEAWEEDEDKKLCWLEAVKILKVCENDCSHEDIVNSNPSVLEVLYIDRLIRNGFIKEEDEEIVSAIERSAGDKEGGVEIEKTLIISEQEQRGCDISFSYGYNVCKIIPEEKQKEESVHTVQAVVNETDLKNKKRNDGYVTNNIAINVVATAFSVMPRITDRSNDLEVIAEQKESVLGDLQKYCDAGIKLIGVYSNGSQIASGADIETAYTCDPEIIKNLMNGKDPRTKGQKINRFYFRPRDCGLLCIDIDIKKGKDGLKEFYEFCKSKGKGKGQLPKVLQELPNNFPCYTATANDGYHLYFKHAWTEEQQKKKSYGLCSGVEITPQLTAAGSFKEGKPYVLHGDISAAALLPKFIETAVFNTEIIKKKQNELIGILQKQKEKPYKTRGKKDWGKPAWQQITEWTERDTSSEIAVGRHMRAFHLAVHAKTHGYSEYETLNEIRNDPTVNSLPEKEIQTIVRSVYKK
jgi:hypothetical protein